MRKKYYLKVTYECASGKLFTIEYFKGDRKSFNKLRDFLSDTILELLINNRSLMCIKDAILLDKYDDVRDVFVINGSYVWHN